MESDSPGRERPSSPAEAQAALAALDVDAVRLAERVVTPWWYHPALGLIVALLVGAQALAPTPAIILTVLGVVLLPVLAAVYTRRYGVSVTRPAGPRSRRLLFATIAVLALAMVSVLVLRAADASPWWAVVPVAIAFMATVALGRRYDDALRGELAHNGPRSA